MRQFLRQRAQPSSDRNRRGQRRSRQFLSLNLQDDCAGFDANTPRRLWAVAGCTPHEARDHPPTRRSEFASDTNRDRREDPVSTGRRNGPQPCRNDHCCCTPEPFSDVLKATTAHQIACRRMDGIPSIANVTTRPIPGSVQVVGRNCMGP